MFAVFYFVLTAHLLFVSCFIFKVPLPLFDRIQVLRYYQSYATLGPFFTEKSVSWTYLMEVSHKTGQWSPWYSPQLDSHQKYLNRMDYQQLKRAEFEKLLAWYALAADEDPEISEYLLDYLKVNLPQDHKTDSVRITITRRMGNYPVVRIDSLGMYQYALQ